MTTNGGTASSIPAGAVRRSLAWVTVATIVAKSSQFLIGIFVARILSPHDFGVFAVALVVFTIVINVSELGVGTAIIREHENLEQIAGTAVTLSIASSAALAALMYFVAPGFAAALGSAEAAVPISILALVVLLGGPGAVPAAILTRDFMQGRRFAADMGNFVVANAVLIALAMSGWGVMAFVWSRVAGQVIGVLMLIILSPRRFRPGFDPRQAKQLVVFGLPIVGSSLVGYTISSISVISVGRALGTAQLGVYTLASNVSNWPLSLFSSVIDSLGLPVFSRVHEVTETLRIYLRNALQVVAGSFFYITTMCLALAQPLIEALYGSKWAAAGPVLACIAIYGTVRVLVALFTVILIARNAPRRLFWIQIAWLVALVPAVLFGIDTLGVVGAALANVAVSLVVVLPLTLWNVHKAAGLSALDMLAPVARPLATAIPAGLVAAGAAALSTEPWLSLLLGGTAGTAFYAIFLASWGARVLRDSSGLFIGSGRNQEQREETNHGATNSVG